MISGPYAIRKYIAWYDFRILFHKNAYPFVPDFVPDFVGVLECVSAPPDKIFLCGPCAQMTMTVRSASKFCARNRSQSPNIFDLDLISRVIPGQIEPWPECQPYCLQEITKAS